MRTSSWALLGTCTALGACGGSDSTLTAGPEAPADRESIDALPPQNTEVGPVCPQCVSAGGETSDFDGGRLPSCADFKLIAPASDAEVELAGYDVAAHRSRLTRSFERSLRWTDLTASSAQPRPTPIAGYVPDSAVHGSVTTGNIQKVFLDPARCTEYAQCTWNSNSVFDCTSSLKPSYALATEVTLASDDGAVNQVFHGAVVLRASLPDLVAASSAASDAAFSFAAHVDIADVQGTLRIEPLPGVGLGYLTLELMYFADGVRGRLSVNLTNDWERQVGTGSDLQPIQDHPLVANFPADACDLEVPPAPLDAPDPRLAGRPPADELALLGSLIAATDTTARWSHAGQQTSLFVELDTPEYACVTQGRINNVPLHLSTADGMLDWSVLAAHDQADEGADLPHRISYYQELTPLSKVWSEVFGAFQLAPETDRIFVRFSAEYPAPSAEDAVSGRPGRAVFEIAQSAFCDSPGVFFCPREQTECLVSPAGAECSIDP